MPSQEVSQTFTGGRFKFTAANINTLESSEYTLVSIAVDTSISIKDFRKEIQDALKNVVEACQSSPRSDNLLLRVLTFDETTREFHGFKELNKCDLAQYDSLMDRLGGATSLFDGTVDSVQAINKYGEELVKEDYSVNSILVVLTDGEDNRSTFTANDCGREMKNSVGELKSESLTSILVGVNVNEPRMAKYLENFKNQAEFDRYIEVEKADPKTLAKLANFISKSISSVSSRVGSGSASQTVASLAF